LNALLAARSGFLTNGATGPGARHGVARNRIGITTSSGLPAVSHQRDEEETMFVIGIDPHRGPHAAAVLDGDEPVLVVLRLRADHLIGKHDRTDRYMVSIPPDVLDRSHELRIVLFRKSKREVL
jgi:hypothetical protein